MTHNTERLSDEQIERAVFAVLRKWNDDRAWDRYTRESGPYDVSSLRPEVLEIIRAVLATLPSGIEADGDGWKGISFDALPPEIEGRLAVWLTLGKDLHPLTINLVVRFARALAAKLADAEKKYGYSDGWRSPDWMDECRQHLREHIEKGDPRDVAAYCAFLWHHGESTSPPNGKTEGDIPSASEFLNTCGAAASKEWKDGWNELRQHLLDGTLGVNPSRGGEQG